MKPLSRPHTTQRLSLWLIQAVGYIAAIVLPWVGINLSIKIHQLQGTPLALSFASIAGITIFTGLWPGVLASVANALIFNYCATAPVQGWSYSARDVIHTGIIVLIGLLVNFFCQRQRTIGDRLRAALASLQARTDSLMEAQQGSNAATWMFNVEDQRTDWTEGGTQVFGRPFSHVADFDSIVCSIVPEDRIHFEDVTGFSLRTGQPLRIEFRVKWPNGDIHWLESRGTPSATNANIWRGVTIDITDRKNAENALVRSEKLAAIGRLSATIAHEINNPLEAVTNLLYLASSDATLAPDTKLYLQGADRELARLANIVRRTLAFVRSKSSAGPADLAEVAESVVAMFRPRCVSHSAEIRLDKAADLKVAAPSDDLWQILTNLVSNACDALANSGGIIEISSIRHERSAVIYVRDNGAGIAAEDIGHIFDPFFTTKPDIGTGIGLSVTRDLVEKNGGRISVHIGNLPPGFRTSFRVELPLE